MVSLLKIAKFYREKLKEVKWEHWGDNPVMSVGVGDLNKMLNALPKAKKVKKKRKEPLVY